MTGYMNAMETWIVSSRPRAWLHRLELALLRKLGLDVRGKSVLEVGCGTGELSRLMVLDKAYMVLATDLDGTGIFSSGGTVLSQHYPNLIFKPLNIDVPWGLFNKWDIVVAAFVLHHLTDWKRAVAEMSRTLHPGGTFAWLDWTWAGLQFFPMFDHPGNGFSAGELAAELRGHGFKVRQVAFAGMTFGTARKG